MYIFPEGFQVRFSIPCKTQLILSSGMTYTFGEFFLFSYTFHSPLSYASVYLFHALNVSPMIFCTIHVHTDWPDFFLVLSLGYARVNGLSNITVPRRRSKFLLHY